MMSPLKRQILSAFLQDQGGVTAIEYALLGGLIAVVIAGSVGLLGGAVAAMFAGVAAAFP